MAESHDNVLELLREQAAAAEKRTRRGIIIQPGGLGDSLLTLPLARFVKDALELGSLEILGHTDYIGILPGRTCVDGIRSMESTELYRLFVDAHEFEPGDGDALISCFADFSWIVSFLGEPGSNFEKNLIYTAHCSRGSEVITMPLKPPAGLRDHISRFYIERFAEDCRLESAESTVEPDQVFVRATQGDRTLGRELLKQVGLGDCIELVVIHPGSGGREKCWYLDNFLSVAEQLRSRGMHVVFLLGPAESERFDREEVEQINEVAPCLSDLPTDRVLGLLCCATTYAGNDSGVTHLAGAMGVKTLVLFGPSDPVVYRPLGPAVVVLQGDSEGFASELDPALQEALLEAIH